MAYPVAGYAGKYSAEVAWQRVQKLLDYLSDRPITAISSDIFSR